MVDTSRIDLFIDRSKKLSHRPRTGVAVSFVSYSLPRTRCLGWTVWVDSCPCLSGEMGVAIQGLNGVVTRRYCLYKHVDTVLVPSASSRFETHKAAATQAKITLIGDLAEMSSPTQTD